MALLLLRPRFIERLRTAHGFQSDTALAAAIGVTPASLSKAKQSGEATPQIMAGISRAFGYGLGEIATVAPERPPREAEAAS